MDQCLMIPIRKVDRKGDPRRAVIDAAIQVGESGSHIGGRGRQVYLRYIPTIPAIHRRETYCHIRRRSISSPCRHSTGSATTGGGHGVIGCTCSLRQRQLTGTSTSKWDTIQITGDRHIKALWIVGSQFESLIASTPAGISPQITDHHSNDLGRQRCWCR